VSFLSRLSGARTGYGLAVLLALSTLDEGGSAPTGLLVWHGLLVFLLLREILAPSTGESTFTVQLGPRIAFTVYTVVLLVGAARAPYGFAAWLQLIEVAAVAGLAWLAARRGPEILSRLAPPLLGVAAAEGALLLVQRFGLGAVRPSGSFLNANHFAAWNLAALLLFWGGRLAAGSAARRRDGAWIALSLLPLAAVVVSGSRGALIGLVAGALAMLGLAWPRLGRVARRAAVVVVLVVLVAAIAGVASRQSKSDPFRYHRVRIWLAAASIVGDVPAGGTGPGQFRNAARAFQFADGDGPLRFDRGFATTHSDLLRLPCELGLPGLAASLALAGFLALGVTRRRATGELTPGAVGAVGALAALASHALVDNLSLRSALYVLAAVLAGGLLSTRGERAASLGVVTRTALGWVLGVTFVVGDVAPFLAWRETRSLPRGRLSDADAVRLSRALVLNPVHPDAWRRRAEHLAGDGTGWDVRLYAAAREAAERAVRLDPTAPEFRIGVARVEALACRSLFAGNGATRDRAARAYGEVERRDPFNAVHALEAAEALADCGDPTAAAAAARRAIELEPEAATPLLVLASALVRSEGSAAIPTATALVEQAERNAAAWASWVSTGSYARRLLAVESRALDRVRKEIALAAAAR